MIMMMTFQQFIISRLIIVTVLGILQGQVIGYDRFAGSECTLKDNSKGICTMLPECATIYNGLITRTVQYSDVVRCGFKDATEVVCCGDQTQSRSKGEKVEEACDKLRELKARRLRQLIYGGRNASLGEFPHMAVLGYPASAAGQDFEWRCGGTLISNLFILSAAHCTKRTPPIKVRLGIVDLNAGNPVDRDVDIILNHPMYQSSLQYHDISLIRMKEPVEFSDNIFPSCLSSRSKTLAPNTEVWVIGWGITENHRTSQTLLKANILITNMDQCNRTIFEHLRTTNSYRKLPNGLNEGQFCAHDPALVKDTCEGDSGGPLQVVDKDGVCVVHGVTSFGVSCAIKIPGVYAKVSYYIDWIESVVWP